MKGRKKRRSAKKTGRRIKSGSLKGKRLLPVKKRPVRGNPERVLIGAKAEKLFYEGGDGKPARSRWVHEFETQVRVWGLPNGSVLLEAVNPSLSLWENMDVTIK